MTTPEAIRLLAAARQLEREGTPTPASQRALIDILKPGGAPIGAPNKAGGDRG